MNVVPVLASYVIPGCLPEVKLKSFIYQCMFFSQNAIVTHLYTNNMLILKKKSYISIYLHVNEYQACGIGGGDGETKLPSKLKFKIPPPHPEGVEN